MDGQTGVTLNAPAIVMPLQILKLMDKVAYLYLASFNEQCQIHGAYPIIVQLTK